MTPEEQIHAAAIAGLSPVPEPRRRLSWLRIVGAVLLAAAVTASIVGFKRVTTHAAAPVPSSTFAPYVDVTATPEFAFEDPAQSSAANVVLGFVVSSPKSACEPTWGTAYTLPAAATGLDLDRRIARLRQRGGQVSVSFGGAANSELAIGCTDATALTAAYRTVVDRYSISTIDLDIEGSTASAPAVDARRATAIAALQQQEQKQHRSVGVWLTLPVGLDGLSSDGRNVLSAMLAAHVSLNGVNAMTMDYGQTPPAGQTMASMAESSLVALSRQLKDAYAQHGVTLSTDQTWQHIGATPMIGQNDTATEITSLADARSLLNFVRVHHVRRLSMWSLNRDQACGPNYADVEVVSDDCSGVNQDSGAFTAIFTAFTTRGSVPIGGPDLPSVAPSAAAAAATAADNPATSPYPIWNSELAYPKGTKIVWHHNVYLAKWYTQGDTPDAPVASPSDTPWTLIGPVLPGEHPVPTPTLAAGTYPQWNSSVVYVAGDRVLYDGVGYQAKWYTQGDVPGIVVADPGDTPWEPLTS